MGKNRDRDATKKPKDKTETVGQRLARLRMARGSTQTALARQVGLNQNALSDFERGRTRLNADALILFAKALDVTADEILGLDIRRTTGLLISHDVLRRAAKLEALPSAMRKHVLRTLDMLLKASRAEI